MKLEEKAFANAVAVLGGAIYIVCDLLVILFPIFFKTISQSWFHGIDISLIWVGGARGNFFLGLITTVIATWFTGWFFARTYNKLVGWTKI